MEKDNHKILKKRIDNYVLYAYLDMLEGVKSSIDLKLSEKSNKLFFQLIQSIYDDIGCLKCDELTACYIIEEGFNYD